MKGNFLIFTGEKEGKPKESEEWLQWQPLPPHLPPQSSSFCKELDLLQHLLFF